MPATETIDLLNRSETRHLFGLDAKGFTQVEPLLHRSVIAGRYPRFPDRSVGFVVDQLADVPQDDWSVALIRYTLRKLHADSRTADMMETTEQTVHQQLCDIADSRGRVTTRMLAGFLRIQPSHVEQMRRRGQVKTLEYAGDRRRYVVAEQIAGLYNWQRPFRPEQLS